MNKQLPYTDDAIERAVAALFQSFNPGTTWARLADSGPIKRKWRAAYLTSLAVLHGRV